MKDVLSISKPVSDALPLIFDSPHSGNVYPDDFNYACDFKTLEAAEDKYVEELFAGTPEHGATFLQALFPRSYIDPNRSMDDVDPALLDDKWSGDFEINPTSRSHAGIGLIRRLIKPGIPVYDRTLSSEEIVNRIENYYAPYHEALEKLITETHYNFGQVWHINCHSMPNSSAYPRRPTGLIGNRVKPSDFVLGDRDGTSCSHSFTRALKAFIKDMGYTVTINDPFKGVELVARHSNPASGFHSLQIEVNKALYMDEETGKKLKNYSKLKDDIEKTIIFCRDFVEDQLIDLAAD